MQNRNDRLRLGSRAILAGAMLLQAGIANANPPLQNADFELVGPNGSPTVHSPPAPGGAGYSAAESWGVFHNTAPATTVTAIVPTTLPSSSGARMLHVETDGVHNGINQVTGPPGSGPSRAIGTAWIFVNSGTVGIGTGNHGLTGIDATTTTSGAWEYLEAPNGFSPANQLIAYAVGGGADFFIDDVGLHEEQGWGGAAHVEYSNDLDEAASPGGGGHAGPDAGQTLYTRPIDTAADSQPYDGIDFFPGIGGAEPDNQVDALAHHMDLGFTRVQEDGISLMFSLAGDPGPAAPDVAAYLERIDGTPDIAMTHRDLHALSVVGEIEDVDALELWGAGESDDRPMDADFFSLEHDFGNTSVWTWVNGSPETYILRTDILNVVNALGFNGSIEEVDLDALMVQDIGQPGRWDIGDEILFSVRAGNAFDGGEIIHWRYGEAPTFLRHGGHEWDTSFDISSRFRVDTEEVDALEVPEAGTSAMLAAGGTLLAALGVARRRG